MKSLFFQPIPDEYQQFISKIQDKTLKKIYGQKNFKFNFFTFSNIEDKNHKIFIEDYLPNYMNQFKFIVYKYFEILNNKDIFICVEGEFLIIEKIPEFIIQSIFDILHTSSMKIIINIDETNFQIKEEISNFCSCFKKENNEFVKKTIRLISCYLIRRFYCPSEYFKDPSFFLFGQTKKSKEHDALNKITNLIKSISEKEIKDYESMASEIVTEIEEIEKDEIIESNNISDNIQFNKKDFIELRTISSQRCILKLVFHVGNFNIFMMKEFEDQSKFQRGIDFCKKYSHRCFTHCHGFLEEKGRIKGIIYEFMSNSSLDSFIKSKKNDEVFSLVTINRITQGIEYLKRNNLIHRDLKPSNILIDHDHIPYISDFESIRHPIDPEKYLSNKNEEMTQDLGSSLYISPEQYNGDFTSFPTDIYLFGLILYFIKEGKNMHSLSGKIKEIKKMTKGSKNLKELFISCVENSTDKRPTIDEIKSKIIDEINSFSNYERILLSDDKIMNKFKIVNFIKESAIIQIGNKKTINKLIQNISLFLSLYYKGKSDVLFGLGKYHYDNKNYYKGNEFLKHSALLNNSEAIRCLLEPFVNDSTDIPKDLNIFFELPEEYCSMLNKIQDKTLQNAYSKFGFNYFPGSFICKNSDIFTNFLINYLKNYKFITYEIDYFNNDDFMGIVDIVICVEGECIIIEKIHEEIIQTVFNELKMLSDSKIILLNNELKSGLIEEITNFCQHFGQTIRENYFISKTIKSVSCFLIRRYFQPTNYFKDPSFFKFNYLIETFSNLNLIKTFNKDDFIELKPISSYSNHTFYMVIHKEKFSIFALKQLKYDNLKESIFQHEIDFCKKHSHRCFIHCYGFLEEKRRIEGIIYEFMSNGSLYSFIESNGNNEIFSLMTINRITQGIEYLQQYNLIHLDFRRSDILIDHDYIPYISDFGNIYRKDVSLSFYTRIKPMIKKFENERILYLCDEIIKKMKSIFHPTNQISKGFIQHKALIQETKKVFIEEMYSNIHNNNLIDEIFKQNTSKILHFIYELILIQQNSYVDEKLSFLLTNKDESASFLIFGDIFRKGNLVKRDYMIAKKMYEFSAQLNNSDALLSLGDLYRDGLGFEQDFSKAKEYYVSAAKYHNSNALNNLGYLYQNGYGVDKNFLTAKEYYIKSAKLNNSTGLLNLGHIYRNGYGTAIDYPKAKYFYEKSAQLNNSNALFSLGHLYFNGYGVVQNYSVALKYFKLSGKLNNSVALLHIGHMYKNGDGVQQNYEKAKKYYLLSSKLYNSDAFFSLGYLYIKGNGVRQNLLLAIYYFEMSAKQDNPKALFVLGYLFSTGEFFEIDMMKAIRYYLRCTNIYNDQMISYNSNDHDISIQNRYNEFCRRSSNDLALIYLLFFEDIDKSILYMKEAAFAEYPFASNNLGLLYQFYFNNMSYAKQMYEKASKKNFALAEYNSAYLCENEEKSIEHYKKASEIEDEPLMFHNARHYDKQLEISKTFIICHANLKLCLYHLLEQKCNESRTYFIKSFRKLIHTKQFSISNLKTFILEFPLFNLKNQSNFDFDLYNETKKLPNISTTKPKSNKSLNNIRNFKEIEEIKHIYLKNDIKYVENEEESTEKDDINGKTTLFDDTGKLFDFFTSCKTLENALINEIQDIIETMHRIIYTKPYPILFGRIRIDKSKPKPKVINYPFMKEINELFYEGFSLEI